MATLLDARALRSIIGAMRVARGPGALVLVIALFGCEGGAPAMCADVACRGPACCGASCTTSADCCEGAVCSADGRCIPGSCRACGGAGCIVDFDACTAECALPSSCGDVCASDAECAPGTLCRPSVTGETRCYPETCARCGGVTPLCSVDDDCSVRCIPPERCGSPCNLGEDCGADAICYAFSVGGYCVPAGFEAACAPCGVRGCVFSTADCTVTCQDDDAGTGADAGVGECGACCATCASDADCCPNTFCGTRDGAEGRQCLPAECASCASGCIVDCP